MDGTGSSAPIDRVAFEPAELAARPPDVHHPNKRLVLGIAFPDGVMSAGPVHYSRWPEPPLPRRLAPLRSERVEAVAGWYDYDPAHVADRALHWWVNFADERLFCCYAGPLLAQDEMQVAEHPILASVQQAVVRRGLPAVTAEGGRATPVLVRGAERRVVIGSHLYGNAFAAASVEEVVAATVPLDPPTVSNILAIAAPGYRSEGAPYTAGELRSILATAIAGFRAAALESTVAGAAGAVVHTGYWGCGAFGGVPELMALLQLVAAHASGIDRLVFHAGSDLGSVERARELADELLPAGGLPTDDLFDALLARGYRWRGGNGT